MQLPITIGLHRSFFCLAGILAAHGLALAGIVSTPWQFWPKAVLFAVFAGSLALSWLRWPPKVRTLRLLRDGRVECRLAGKDEFLEAELSPGATVHPWLTVVRLKFDHDSAVAVVLPDSTTPEEFRRLRVWLRWRAEFTAGKDGAA